MKKIVLIIVLVLISIISAKEIIEVKTHEEISKIEYRILDKVEKNVIWESKAINEKDTVKAEFEDFMPARAGEDFIFQVLIDDEIIYEDSDFLYSTSFPEIVFADDGIDLPGELLEPTSPMAVGLRIHGGENTQFDNGIIIGGPDLTEPVGNLDVRDGEARIWDGSASVGYVSGTGDLYVEDQLEVDGTIYAANWRDAAGNNLLNGGTGITVSENTNGQWTISSSAASGDDDWTIGSGVVYNNTDEVAIGTSTSDGHGLNVEHYSSGNAAIRGADEGSYVYAEGLLGVLSYSGIPDSPTNIGVLGIKTEYGSNGVAVYGWNQDNTTDNWAVYGVANGSGGTNNYGIYGSASGATNNYAGYFDGDVHISSDLGIGTSSPTAQIHSTGDVRHQNLSETSSNVKIVTVDDAGNLAWRSPGEWTNCTSLWNDDFEDGSITEYCTSSYLTASTARAHTGSYSGRVSGDPSGHYNAAAICFSGIEPEYISWWVYPDSPDESHAYFVVQDGTIGEPDSQITMIYYYSSGAMRFIGGSSPYTDVSVPADTWHHVEMKNIDWLASEFDVYLNESLVESNLGFRGSASDIDRIFLYNFASPTTAYYDDIWIGDMCGDEVAALFRIRPGVGASYVPNSDESERAFISGAATLDGSSIRVEFPEEFKSRLGDIAPIVVTTPLEAASKAVHIEETKSEYFILATDDETATRLSFNWIAVEPESQDNQMLKTGDSNHQPQTLNGLDENGNPIDNIRK